MSELIWPAAPTCHAGAQRFSPDPISWREPRLDAQYGQRAPFRTCSYCGSMHAGDLAELLESNPSVSMHGSDWKYGWPHKFYVEDVPNLTPGVGCEVGSMTRMVDGVATRTPTMGKSSATIHAKFYSEHLSDEGYGAEAIAKIIALLAKHTGIEFSFGERGLAYCAPCAGYQR